MEFQSLLVVVCFLVYMNLASPVTSATLSNETDHLALLAFKSAITDDPLQVLSSWNDSLHHCQWVGISCGNRHKQKVVSLNLDSQKLGGELSPHVGNLSFLKILNLSNNFFTGEIPPELGRLFRLKVLTFGNNTFKGEIPVNLSYYSSIRLLDLANNNLSGRIPARFGSLGMIRVLWLGWNKLIGSIPSSLGNLSSLRSFDLQENLLSGEIPHDLARLHKVRFFAVADNHLRGTIPPKLYNLSRIDSFFVARNQLLEGTLPWDIGLTLPNLESLAVGANRFTGTIPVSLLNCSNLTYLELYQNMFTGPLPQDLGRLQHLSILTAPENYFGSGEGSRGNDLQFLSSLTNCSNLWKIYMGANDLTGPLPSSIANLSSRLEIFDFIDNRIHGQIPSGIGNLVGLNYFSLDQNNISGHIPDTLGDLQALREVYLSFNSLTGRIPSSIGNLTHLNIFSLYENKVDGSIPSSIGNCQNLVALDLSFNSLTGIIPIQLFDILSLSRGLGLAHNFLTGPLLLQVGKLNNLERLLVFDNKLSGSIPVTLGDCVHLLQVRMQGNSFSGKIPETLRALRGIEELELSRNNLTGVIPDFLGNLPFLKLLNLSYNDLEGKVPQEGIFKNASAFNVEGNHKLCGGSSRPLCPTLNSRRRGKSVLLKVIIPLIIVGLCLALVACYVIIRLKRRMLTENPSSESSFKFRRFKISYPELVKATNSFSEANLLGFGSYSSVYKGILEQDGMIVAVKVLNLQHHRGSKSFTSECEALRDVRHRNLVKILTSCSSVDFQGNDFKALVFEFMPNGNLERWLYPEADDLGELRNLSLGQRLIIAIDVASALDHLHRYSQSTIVHCDLKPSNVLLDRDMTARVGDFGLAKILSPVSDNLEQSLTSSAAVKGSIGYVPPEYGLGSEVSTQGDVYSYGVLLIEMFTGRRPTDDSFNDGLSLHSFASMSLPKRVLEIIDPHLLEDEGYEGEMLQEFLVAVLIVGVACSMESPRDRMKMGDVVMELNSIRDVYQGVRNDGWRRSKFHEIELSSIREANKGVVLQGEKTESHMILPLGDP